MFRWVCLFIGFDIILFVVMIWMRVNMLVCFLISLFVFFGDLWSDGSEDRRLGGGG